MTKRALAFQAPLQLPVNVGDTSPNPGIAGVIIWSNVTSSHLLWSGTQWAALSSGGGGGGGGGGTYAPASGTAVVDFGVTPLDQATVTVPNVSVTANSFIAISLSPIGTVDHSADEAAVEAVSFSYSNIVPGVSFDIVGTCGDVFGLTGQFLCKYVILN